MKEIWNFLLLNKEKNQEKKDFISYLSYLQKLKRREKEREISWDFISFALIKIKRNNIISFGIRINKDKKNTF